MTDDERVRGRAMRDYFESRRADATLILAGFAANPALVNVDDMELAEKAVKWAGSLGYQCVVADIASERGEKEERDANSD